METRDWGELLDDDEDDGCLSRESCVEELLRDARQGCLYCRLSGFDEGDDD